MFPISPRVARRLASPLAAALVLAALWPLESDAQTLIPARSVWKYLANGTDQESFWTQPAFNDSAWPSGSGPLGFGDPHIVTTLPSGFITYYFRRAFTVADPTAVPGLKVRLLRDDGAVVYLNGVEIFRSNMPAGPVTFNTLAFNPVGGTDETNYFEATVSSALLMAGANLVAVEVHQASLASSDVGFDLELLGTGPVGNTPPTVNSQSLTITKNDTATITLTGSDPDGDPLTFSIVTAPGQGSLSGTPPRLTYIPRVDFVGTDSFTFKANDGTADSSPAVVTIQVQNTPPPPSGLVPLGSVWNYSYDGFDPGPGWFDPFFDDSFWASGPAQLGFGDGDEATVIGSPGFVTAYFRHTFEVTDVSTIPGLRLNLYRDDGAVVYLNGVEVLRNNMPPGPVTDSTLAAANAADDGNTAVSAALSSGLLVNGANLLAVEVHQVNVASSDLSFDLSLLAEAPPQNHAPVADNQSVALSVNNPIPITLTASDADGDPLTFILVSSPAHGSLSGTLPNLIYTPTPGYSGPDSFQFKVNDGALDSPVATVSILVKPAADAPDLVSVSASCDGTEVMATFDEPLDPISATDLFNYTISDQQGNGFILLAASLSPDHRTVTFEVEPSTPLTPGGTYLFFAFFVCDPDGDCGEGEQSALIQFDTIPPTVTCGVVINNLWPPNKRMVDVGLSAYANDRILALSVYSDEPQSPLRGDAQLVNGVLQLRACRNDQDNGRVYLIVVTSTDTCGNVGVCCTTVVVPANNSAAARASVQAQATDAQAHCSPSGAPSTPHLLLP